MSYRLSKVAISYILSHDQAQVLTLQYRLITMVSHHWRLNRIKRWLSDTLMHPSLTNAYTVASWGSRGWKSCHPEPCQVLSFWIPFLWRGSREGQENHYRALVWFSNSFLACWTCTSGYCLYLACHVQPFHPTGLQCFALPPAQWSFEIMFVFVVP